MDFVLETGSTILPIETKLHIKKPGITVGLKNFIEKYKPPNAYLVNLSLSQRSLAYGKTRVDFIYPFELLRERLALPVNS